MAIQKRSDRTDAPGRPYGAPTTSKNFAAFIGRKAKKNLAEGGGYRFPEISEETMVGSRAMMNKNDTALRYAKTQKAASKKTTPQAARAAAISRKMK